MDTYLSIPDRYRATHGFVRGLRRKNRNPCCRLKYNLWRIADFLEWQRTLYGTFVPLRTTSVPLTSARLAVFSIASQVQVF